MDSKRWTCRCQKDFKSKYSMIRHQKTVCTVDKHVSTESSIASRSRVQLAKPYSITQAGVQNECQHNLKSTTNSSKKIVRKVIVTKKRKKPPKNWPSKREINNDSQSNNSSDQTTQSESAIETGRYVQPPLMHYDEQDIIPSDANELPEPAKVYTQLRNASTQTAPQNVQFRLMILPGNKFVFASNE